MMSAELIDSERSTMRGSLYQSDQVFYDALEAQAKAAIELRDALERVHRSIDYSTCNIGVGVIGDLLQRYEA